MPGDRRWIDVQASKGSDLLVGEGRWIGLADFQLRQPSLLDRRELPLPVDHRHQSIEQRLIRLRVLVKHSSVDLSSEKIVRSSDRVNITGQMKIELIHGNHLSVTTARRATLDAEGRTLTRLTKTSDDILLQMSTESLTETDRRRALAFA